MEFKECLFSFKQHKLGLQGELVPLWRSKVTEVSCFGDIKYQNHHQRNSSEGPEGIFAAYLSLASKYRV